MKKNFYFASANTGDGFVNFLNQINIPNQKSFQYIIKGGSGTGKSTMMKKIAEHFEKQKYSIEYFFCSTDTNSLDGIRIVEKNISIVDGTAPHIIDADLPSVKNKIINVGEFINLEVKTEQKKLEKLTKKKKEIFDEIYLLLSTAKNLQDIELKKTYQNLNTKIFEQEAENIIKNFNLKKGKCRERQLFFKAYNFNNNNLQKLNKFTKILKINKNKLKNNIFLNILVKKLKDYKINLISIKNNLDSNLCDGVIFKNIFVTFDDYKINNLIKKIIFRVNKKIDIAKKIHSRIEEIYIQNVNFKQVDLLTEKIIKEIESF